MVAANRSTMPAPESKGGTIMKSTYTFPNRSLLRRLLSTFLSLAMVLSLLPV